MPTPIFEISADTKRLWLATRKEQRGILPGLFRTDKFSTDAAFLWVVIFLEIGGFAAITVDSGLGAAAWIVLGCLVADVFCAIWLHYGVGDRQRAKNELVTIDSANTPRVGLLKRSVNKYKWKDWIAKVLIVLLGLLKAFFFTIAHGGLDQTVILLGIGYLACAVFNIEYTMYAVSESKFKRAEQGDRDRFEDGDEDVTATQFRIFDFTTLLRLNSATVDKHTLEFFESYLENGEPKYRHILTTFGILTDDQLGSLVGAQEDDTRREMLAKEGLKHQLLILTQDANRAAVAPPVLRGNATVTPPVLRGNATVTPPALRGNANEDHQNYMPQ
jgi:hypothetical protein